MWRGSILGILVLLLWAATPTDMAGQTLKLGVQGNYSISQSLIGSYTSFKPGEITSVPAGSIGMSGFIAYRFHDRWSLAAEPGINSAESLIRAENRMDVLLTENRLSLPLMAKYSLSDRLSASVGFAAAFLVGKRETVHSEQALTGSNYRDFTLSVAGGLSLQIAPTAALGMRYQRGVTNSYDISIPRPDTGDFEKMSTRQHQLQFFVRFFILAEK